MLWWWLQLMLCPCKSNKEYKDCCEPFIKGLQLPQTPLELMKSRYSAYATSNLKYIQETQTEKLSSEDILVLNNWSKNTHWQHLEIVGFSDNFVEFKAYYIYDKIQHLMHEKSKFIKIDNRWIYDSGNLQESNLNIGRNDNCVCQSGKKYKKCCIKYL
jgi:SEC-C motif-containing protein